MTDTTLGAALRDARIAAGLTVEDVCARTCIRSTVLRDLEGDRVASSGGLVYARGHVKAICTAVGVDPAPYLELFGRQHGGDVPVAIALAEPTPVRAVPPLRVPRAARPERRGPNWTAAGAAAVVVLVGLLVAGQVVQPQSPVADAAGAAGPVTSPSAAPTKAPARRAAEPARTGVELRVRAVDGDSWIGVRDGAGRPLFEGLLRAGTVRDFRDPTVLRLVLGDAGAVRLGCSGRTVGPAGPRGAVRRFACTRQGIAPT